MSGNTDKRFEWETEPGDGSGKEALLSTGIDVLDRKLEGGIPSGKIVALSARPASQSELFLYEMSSVRETVYLTTDRRATDVEESFREREVPLSEIDVHRIDDDRPLQSGREAVQGIPERSLLVVDTVNPLERGGASEYRSFLNEVKGKVVEKGGLAVLHCLDGEANPPQRDRTEYIADVIFSLNTNLRGKSVENTLSVPKFRGGRALPEAVELDLTSDVTIDVSRKIA